jgi:two-component system sensor histidine kinase MprB
MRVDEIVASCVDRARRRAGGISISVELEPTLLTGRPERIDRAVGNLLDNATKWTPAGGRIEVRLQDGTIAVSDSGEGIAEDDVDHVFDRFYRARAARGTPGSGLGLAIVKQVAEDHGGSVAAGRATLGGARLTLSLPGSEPVVRASPEATGATE